MTVVNSVVFNSTTVYILYSVL